MNCHLCKQSNILLYAPRMYAFAGEVYDLNRCSDCGVVFVAPTPQDSTIQKMYGESYFEEDYSLGAQGGSYLETALKREPQYQEISRILQSLDGFQSGKKILEVGCAAGGFLNFFKRRGWEVEGVDVSDWAVEKARELYGIPVRKGKFESLGLESNTYDAIYMGDVFEHLTDPARNLKEAYRILKPGGLLVIEIPTYVNSVYFRGFRKMAPALRKVLSPKLQEALKIEDGSAKPKPPYHLFEFDRTCLEKLLRQQSFEVIYYGKRLWLPAFLGGMEKAVFLILKFLIEKLGCLPAARAIVVARKPL